MDPSMKLNLRVIILAVMGGTLVHICGSFIIYSLSIFMGKQDDLWKEILICFDPIVDIWIIIIASIISCLLYHRIGSFVFS